MIISKKVKVIKKTLFLFAHQDDEAAAFGLINNEIKKGRSVICFFLTTGSLYLNERYTIKRNKESLNVLMSLGVKKEDIYFSDSFGNLLDQHLIYNIQKILFQLIDYLKNFENINRIYVPSWEGGHPDHDAANIIGAILMKRFTNIKAYQFSFYNSYKCVKPFFRVLAPLVDNGKFIKYNISLIERIRYIFLCLCYPSQFKSWLGLFPFVAYKYLFNSNFFIQKVNFDRIFTRPHNSILYYESRNFAEYSDLSSCVELQIKILYKDLNDPNYCI
jgi:hypothetical protein